MNVKREEYGEERFAETVKSLVRGSAADVVDGVFEAMKDFAGKAKQQDAMTIVVVKIV